MQLNDFRDLVYEHYDPTGRGMPWRLDTRPYYVVVSELMLQQTQVARVIPKFNAFIEEFPSFEDLAEADFKDILKLWDGLGYNRRAQFLHKIAKVVVKQHNGTLPQTRQELEGLPGIGPGTSGAILAYAFNQPAAYIETNIRSVYIHHFFSDEDQVDDKDILRKVEETLDRENPRQWYWALMDYGSILKNQLPNPSRRSKHHVKQSRFEGSDRQLRGQILKKLLEGSISHKKLAKFLNDERTDSQVEALLKEGMIKRQGQQLSL